MRLLIDSLVALMLAGVLGGVVVAHRQTGESEERFEQGYLDLRAIQRQVQLQATLEQVPCNEHGWPVTIDTAWFKDSLPDNPLMDNDRPWMEVASPLYARLDHPLDRATADPRAAQFWYNPAKGVVRARVPVGVSDQESLTAYNRLNGVHLQSLFDDE